LRRCHAVGRCKALFAAILHTLERLDCAPFSVARGLVPGLTTVWLGGLNCYRGGGCLGREHQRSYYEKRFSGREQGR
jgi:hypothetical protein